MNNTLTKEELAELSEPFMGVNSKSPFIQDKNVDPKSPNFKRKGETYFHKSDGVWYIRYHGDSHFTRVQWWQLDSHVGEDNYGAARYVGMNPSIFGKVGNLTYTSKKWIFHFDGEKYPLVNPDSVEMLD